MSQFENHQWEVTDESVKSKRPAPPYEIVVERLTETTERSGKAYYEWPLHMAEKSWIIIDDFIEAFIKALELYAGHGFRPSFGVVQRAGSRSCKARV